MGSYQVVALKGALDRDDIAPLPLCEPGMREPTTHLGVSLKRGFRILVAAKVLDLGRHSLNPLHSLETCGPHVTMTHTLHM